MRWVPFHVDPEEHLRLVDGTLAWMISSLREWFVAEFTSEPSSNDHRALRMDRLRRMELETRICVADRVSKPCDLRRVFEGLEHDDERLRLLDWAVRRNTVWRWRRNRELERILREGGSKWKVGWRRWWFRGLVDRTDDTYGDTPFPEKMKILPPDP